MYVNITKEQRDKLVSIIESHEKREDFERILDILEYPMTWVTPGDIVSHWEKKTIESKKLSYEDEDKMSNLVYKKREEYENMIRNEIEFISRKMERLYIDSTFWQDLEEATKDSEAVKEMVKDIEETIENKFREEKEKNSKKILINEKFTIVPIGEKFTEIMIGNEGKIIKGRICMEMMRYYREITSHSMNEIKENLETIRKNMSMVTISMIASLLMGKGNEYKCAKCSSSVVIHKAISDLITEIDEDKVDYANIEKINDGFRDIIEERERKDKEESLASYNPEA